MKLPDEVQNKLRDPEAIVLPRVTPVKKGEMTICYHCDGKTDRRINLSLQPRRLC